MRVETKRAHRSAPQSESRIGIQNLRLLDVRISAVLARPRAPLLVHVRGALRTDAVLAAIGVDLRFGVGAGRKVVLLLILFRLLLAFGLLLVLGLRLRLLLLRERRG